MLAALLVPLAVKASVSSPVITGNCSPSRVHFAGRIESNAAGAVKYTWARSDKPSSATFDLKFDAPGGLPVTYDWILKGPAEGWVVLQVISPEKVNSGKIRFELKCK
jgi:hypothetical protein